MESKADLHIHTVYSDGSKTPGQIFEMAKNIGLAAISFTDHDSVDGCREALDLKDKFKIDFVPGIELSCYEDFKEYHVLGYGIDIEEPDFNKHLDEFRIARLKRAEKILEKLDKIDITLNWEDILTKAGKAPIARPHIASALIDGGYTKNVKEAFMLYLGEGKPAYEAKTNFTVDRAIKMINKAGGIAVLAHPAKSVTQDALYRIIEKGLDGIECIHPMHDYEMQKFYKRIARQFWLLETGGSDYHGTRDFDKSNFGKFVVPYSVVDSIRYRSHG